MMAEGTIPATTCTALIPYRPFFPIPWKASNQGRFTLAQLRPVEIPADSTAIDRTPHNSPRLPRFELNPKVAGMLARRATIMGCLNGEYDALMLNSPEKVSSGITSATRLARSQSTPALPLYPTAAPHPRSILQQEPPNVSAPISQRSFSQNTAAPEQYQSCSSTHLADHQERIVAPSSSPFIHELYDDGEDEDLISYSQDYGMQEESDEEDSMVMEDEHGYMNVETDQDMQEYEEAALNGFDQPSLQVYYATFGQDGEYSYESRPHYFHDQPVYVSDVQEEEEDEEDTTTFHAHQFRMPYEDHDEPRFAVGHGVQTHSDYEMQHEAHAAPRDTIGHADRTGPETQTQQDLPTLTTCRGEEELVHDKEQAEYVDHHRQSAQDQYNGLQPDYPEGEVPAFVPYAPQHLARKVTPEFNNTIDELETDHDVTVDLDSTVDDLEADYHVTQELEDAAHSLQADDQPRPASPRYSPRMTQWRVGKVAGHQGSYFKRIKEDQDEDVPRGTKRTLKEDIEHTVERVLKKPFITPRPVIKPVAKSPDLIDLTDGEDDPALGPPSVPKSRKPSPFPMLTPTSKVPASKASASLSKPFKTPARAIPSSTVASSPSKSSTHTSRPFDRSVAPSPTTHLGTSPAKLMSSTPISGRTKRSSPPSVVRLPSSAAKASPAQADKTKLAHLETRLRQLREAVNYDKNTEEEDAISSVTEQWLVAGRDIAERLFDRIPQPHDLTPVQTQPLLWGMAKTGGWDSSNDDHLTDEQRSFLATVGRDDDGDPVDDEGNKLVEDISRDMSSLSRTEGGSGPYKPNLVHAGRYATAEEPAPDDMAQSESSPPEPQWNIGTMLFRLGVDPALLGWDAEGEF